MNVTTTREELLTPIQRLGAYNILLAYLMYGTPLTRKGLCQAIWSLYPEVVVHVDLPELYAQKPNKEETKEIGYWWPIEDKESRIAALQAAIDEVQKLMP